MSIILINIGIIALIVLGKFIYDTYLTNNTNRNWQEFKNKYPEDATRLDRNNGLDFSTKPKINLNDRNRSLTLIAKQCNCQENEVKEIFLSDLRLNHIPLNEKENLIGIFHKKKIEESKYLNMDPDDTPSAYMEKWALEYFADLEEKKSKQIELPKNYIEQHKKSSYKKLLNKMIESYENDPNTQIRKDTIDRIKFLASDGISQFIHILNSTFLKNDDSLYEYFDLLKDSIYIVKERYSYFVNIYPIWFLAAYPDVVVWSIEKSGNILPTDIKNKIEKRKIRSEYDEFSDWIKKEFYEMKGANNNEIELSDLRIIVNLYKKNKDLECLGIDN